MILVGAFYFVTAGGDEDKVETAKKYILYAAVGLAIALLAKAIVEIVQSFVA
jgi:NADH:ubiquinone oxidoreductase subunit 4 (subunit M)